MFSCRSLLLNTVLNSFKPAYIAARAIDFVNLIVASEDDGNLKEFTLKILPSVL